MKEHFPTIHVAALAGSFEVFNYLLQIDESLINSRVEDENHISFLYIYNILNFSF